MLETYSFVSQTDYRCGDGFLSWGWDRHAGCLEQATPVPAPLLNTLSRREAGQAIVLVGTNVPGCNSRFDSALFREHLPAYRDAQRRFALALDAGTRPHLAIRPYGRTAASERAFWRTAAPDVPFVEGPLSPQLETSRVVVIDHPGTTLLMTLAAHIPTVAFWNREVWRMAVSAEPEIEGLRRAGILFDDPESAAAHVSRVSGNVSEWWDAVGTQQAVDRFTSKLARHSHDWLPAWQAALSGGHA
jgi:putative transferase (TIGR04331 family)